MFFVIDKLRWAERIWPPSGTAREHWQESEAQPNGEGVAAGSATEMCIFFGDEKSIFYLDICLMRIIWRLI